MGHLIILFNSKIGNHQRSYNKSNLKEISVHKLANAITKFFK